jgi:alkylation response protein AidB-like acyl-CoA dehydrogenase
VLSASVRPEISAEDAALADAEGALPKGVVAELTAAGFARALVPAGRGGAQSGFEELFHAVAAVAERCASAAWCAALWALHGKYAARLPEEGGREIWRDTPDVRISAAVVPPSGTARRVEGGWSVRGRWEFASGIEHAHWVLLAARTEPGEVRVLAVPEAELEVERGWDAVGLRGTGSHRVLAHDVFVPDRRSMTFAEMTRAEPAPDTPRCQAVPAFLFGGVLLAAVALGAARAALADWAPAAGLSADATAAAGLTRASGELEAARLLLTGAIRRADSGSLDEAAVAVNMRDAAVGVGLLVDCVERLLHIGGTASRAGGGGFHRGWRDVHTVASHGALRIGTAAAAYARAVEAGTVR